MRNIFMKMINWQVIRQSLSYKINNWTNILNLLKIKELDNLLINKFKLIIYYPMNPIFSKIKRILIHIIW